MRRKHLIVMVKEPHPGRVKTRLGRGIGRVAAAWWFRHQTASLLRQLDDPRWQLWLAVSPDSEGLQSRVWPAHLPRLPQGRGDLGARMSRLMRGAPTGPVCVIGGDIPGVTRAHVARAFAALGRHDAVFGPAPDGGFWLVGLRRTAPPPPEFFKGVRWSSEFALSDSLATLPGLRIAQTDILADVDTIEDLNALRG